MTTTATQTTTNGEMPRSRRRVFWVGGVVAGVAMVLALVLAVMSAGRRSPWPPAVGW
jgi:hypothetical protein